MEFSCGFLQEFFLEASKKSFLSSWSAEDAFEVPHIFLFPRVTAACQKSLGSWCRSQLRLGAVGPSALRCLRGKCGSDEVFFFFLISASGTYLLLCADLLFTHVYICRYAKNILFLVVHGSPNLIKSIATLSEGLISFLRISLQIHQFDYWNIQY